MWQRVQTLYLAIATGLLAALFFCKFATIIGPMGDNLEITYREKTFYLILLIIVTALNGLALCAYRVRMLQFRLCILTAIVLLGFQIWLAVDILRNLKQMVFSFTAIFPIVSAILDVLAARNVMIDETLVKSSSRLRPSRSRKRPNKK